MAGGMGDDGEHLPTGGGGVAERSGGTAVNTDGNLTSAAESGQRGALGGDGETRGGIIEEGKSGKRDGVIDAGFQAERALAGRGTDEFRGDALAEPVGFFQAVKAGGGEQDGIHLTLGEFAQARIDVAAEFDGFKIGAVSEQLCAAAQAAGADARACGQIGKRAMMHGDEHVAGIDARGCGGEDEAFGQCGGKVLEAVNGEIDASCGKRLLNFQREHAFGADLGEGDLLQTVAGGTDNFQFDGVTGGAQQGCDVMRLPEGELGAARADADHEWPRERATRSGDSMGVGVGSLAGFSGSDHSARMAAMRSLSPVRAACLSA